MHTLAFQFNRYIQYSILLCNYVVNTTAIGKRLNTNLYSDTYFYNRVRTLLRGGVLPCCCVTHLLCLRTLLFPSS